MRICAAFVAPVANELMFFGSVYLDRLRCFGGASKPTAIPPGNGGNHVSGITVRKATEMMKRYTGKIVEHAVLGTMLHCIEGAAPSL